MGQVMWLHTQSVSLCVGVWVSVWVCGCVHVCVCVCVCAYARVCVRMYVHVSIKYITLANFKLGLHSTLLNICEPCTHPSACCVLCKDWVQDYKLPQAGRHEYGTE